MINLTLSVIAFGCAAGGPVVFLRAFRLLRMRRLIENTPTSHIRSVAMGLAEISGTAAPRSAIRSPFSNTVCAFWEVDISTQGRRGEWTVVHRNASGHPFFVQDGTGAALIYPSGAECKVPIGKEETCAGPMLPDCYSRYMADEGLGMRHLWCLSNMRFRERLLEEGERVFVLGTAMPRPHAVDISADQELAATGTGDASATWHHTLDTEASVVFRRGENEPTFIVSQQSERSVTVDLGLRAFAGLIGGPALTLFGLGVLLLELAPWSHSIIR